MLLQERRFVRGWSLLRWSSARLLQERPSKCRVLLPQNPHRGQKGFSYKTPANTWWLELPWGFIWLRKICGNKIKLYMYPIGKDTEMSEGWAWSPRRASTVTPSEKSCRSLLQLETKPKPNVRPRGCAGSAETPRRSLPPCCKLTPRSALTFKEPAQQFIQPILS